MGFQSQAGQVGFRAQSAKGTFADPGTSGVFALLRSGAIGGNRDLLIPDAEIGGNRDVRDAYLGPVSFSGEYEFYGRPDIIATMLKGAFGSVSTGSTTDNAQTVYTHTFTPFDGDNEVQTVTITGTPTGGNFTLTFRGQTTAAIAHNASSAAVQSAFTALSTVGAGNATVSGGPLPGTAVTITFSGALAKQDVPAITATSSLTGGVTPTITISTSTGGGSSLPWYSIEEKIGSGFETFKYTDAKVNTFHMEADSNGYLMGRAGFVALTQQAGASATSNISSLQDTKSMFVGSNITVAWNGVNLPAKSFSLDVNNNMETDDFRLGSLFLGDITEKRREVMMNVTIRPDDSSLWRAAMYGSMTATTPGGTVLKDDVAITISSYEKIGTALTNTYQVTFTIPTAAIKPFQVSPSGDDVIQHDLEIQALRPSAGTSIITATVKTDKATVS